MNFAYPEILVWLFFPVLLLIVLYFDLKSQAKSLESNIPKKLWARLFPSWNPKARSRKAVIFCVALVFGILALAKPRWGYREEIVQTSGIDLIVALDVSRSMDVEDIVPSRIKKTRHWIRNFLRSFQGNRVGIVAFASSSFLASPLTTDLDYVSDIVEILGPSSVVNQGTDIGIGLGTAVAALERGSESAALSEEDQNKKSRAILLISDGEDHEEAFIEAAKKTKLANIQLLVVGVGTLEGGPIPILDESGKVEGFKRGSQEPVVSRFNPDNLKKIAEAAYARYWTMSPSESEVKEIIGELGGLRPGEVQERRSRVPIERFQWPLLISIVLFILELSLPLVLSLRKKRILAGLFVFICFDPLLSIPGARAESIQGYLKNRDGLSAFDEKDLNRAKESFGNARIKAPESLEPKFNLGVVDLNEGKLNEAIKSFEQIAREAAMNGNANLTAQSLYNLGSAYEKGQKRREAVRNFAAAIRMAEHAGNTDLAKEARKRIQIIEEQNQSRQNNQNKSGEGQEGSEGDDSNSQNGSDEKAKNPSSYEDPSVSRRRDFKSQKLTLEDSERVMSELSARERELQSKLKKQRGTRQVPNEKDW